MKAARFKGSFVAIKGSFVAIKGSFVAISCVNPTIKLSIAPMVSDGSKSVVAANTSDMASSTGVSKISARLPSRLFLVKGANTKPALVPSVQCIWKFHKDSKSYKDL